MRNSKKQFFWATIFFVIVSAGMTGCAKTGSTYTTSPVTYVTVMNMAPYGPTTDVYLNSQNATGTAGIAPGAYSSKYGALQPGSYTIQFKKNGSDSLLTSISNGQAQILDTLNFYSLIMYQDVNKVIQSTLIHDDFTSISTGNANYRFWNLSPDAPNVDFYLNTGTSPVYTNRTPGDNAQSGSPYNYFLSTASSTYNLTVMDSKADTVITYANNQSLVGGNVYTFILGGTKGNFKLNILPASY